MDRPGDAQRPPTGGKNANAQQMSFKTYYLINYNSISAIFWAVILTVVTGVLATSEPTKVYDNVGLLTIWVQSLAGLEVLHSLAGVVRAPLFTTFMQVASRIVIVWGIVNTFPEVTGRSPAYGTMVLAWSATEVVRYSYFAVNLAYGKVPGWLTWLRYNMFFILYPMGISSECWLVYLATGPAERYGPVIVWALRAVLLVYIPGMLQHWCRFRKNTLTNRRFVYLVHAHDGSTAESCEGYRPEEDEEDEMNVRHYNMLMSSLIGSVGGLDLCHRGDVHHTCRLSVNYERCIRPGFAQ